MTRLRVLSILTGFCSTLELVCRVVPGFSPTLTFELDFFLPFYPFLQESNPQIIKIFFFYQPHPPAFAKKTSSRDSIKDNFLKKIEKIPKITA